MKSSTQWIALGILYVRVCPMFGLMLASILWDSKNPIFDENLCSTKSLEFYAQWNDEITIMCGNRYLNTYPTNLMQSNEYYYNIFMTDNKTIFDSRNGVAAELFHVCKPKWHSPNTGSESLILDIKRKMFRRLSDERKTFYFFTTSDGTIESLENEHGDKTSMRMHFSLYICPIEDKICVEKRHRINLCFLPDEMSLQTSKQSNPPSSYFNDPVVIVVLLVMFTLGLILGAVGMFMRTHCLQNEPDEEQSPGPILKSPLNTISVKYTVSSLKQDSKNSSDALLCEGVPKQ